MRLADITPPDSAAARAALEFATEYHTPSLLNHVLRSWFWAEGFASVEGLHGIDRELLYVSAVLHDIGIVPAFDNHTLAYEDAGGHVAKALTAGAGWRPERRTRAHEVIVRHNWPEVDPAFDPEGHLLEAATALDISGVRPDALPREFLREVVTAFPRLDLAAEFTACVTDQAERKPGTAAQRIVERGVAGKLRSNPLESLG
jgi:hypothetical protein